MTWESKNCHNIMEKYLSSFKESLAKVRVGRASTGLVESIQVEVYGQKMKLFQVASIDIAGDMILLIKPFDSANLNQIQKAIQVADIGLSCRSDGGALTAEVPRMNEDSRNRIIKSIKEMLEDAKIRIRSIRRDEMEVLKSAQKDKEISEDEFNRNSRKVQDLTNDYISKIEETTEKKIVSIKKV